MGGVVAKARQDRSLLPELNVKERETFGFVGCGRVGRTLARAFANAGRAVTAAWSRRATDAELMVGELPGLRALPSAQAVADTCDFVWITVSDDAIGPVSDGIVWSPRHKVVHCSGATEVQALVAARKAGAAIGGFHPLQMFTNPAVALKGLPGCTVGIEADSALYDSLNQLALDIGCAPVLVPAGDRVLYHASAYYVGPFLIAFPAEGVALWQKFGVGEKEALNALLPLLSGTLSAVGVWPRAWGDASQEGMSARCASTSPLWISSITKRAGSIACWPVARFP